MALIDFGNGQGALLKGQVAAYKQARVIGLGWHLRAQETTPKVRCYLSHAYCFHSIPLKQVFKTTISVKSKTTISVKNRSEAVPFLRYSSVIWSDPLFFCESCAMDAPWARQNFTTIRLVLPQPFRGKIVDGIVSSRPLCRWGLLKTTHLLMFNELWSTNTWHEFRREWMISKDIWNGCSLGCLRFQRLLKS